ncbi:hypothetical protein [Streptomyces sp. NPDC049879]|uniref:hypothetical protein n=1 Tax=Streptomyces sp. NPDC049879 TaxID=3365598 RepID=UPI0037B73B70
MIGRRKDRRGTSDAPLEGRVIPAGEPLPEGAEPRKVRKVGVFTPSGSGPTPAAPASGGGALPPPRPGAPRGGGAHEGAHSGDGQDRRRTRRMRAGWERGGPDAPHDAEHLPPWRRRAAPPPPPAPPGGLVPAAAAPAGGVPVQVIHHVHHVIVDPGPDVPPKWSWDWLAAALIRWARPRQLLVAVPLTIPAATVWIELIQQCRAEAGIPAGYVVAAVPFLYFIFADSVSHRLFARVGLFTSAIGLGAAFSPWDFVQLMTGVGL